MAKYWEMNLDNGAEEIEFHDKDAVEKEDGELNDTIITYEGNTSDVQSWTNFIASFVNGMKIGKFFKNLYAGIQYVLHVGSLVNNCVTDNSDLPLSAAQGKVLMDELTQVKSDLTELSDVKTWKLSCDYLSGSISFYKVGRVVICSTSERSFTQTLSSGWNDLIELPDELIPVESVATMATSYGTGTSYEVAIRGSGYFSIYPRLGTITTDDRLSTAIAYIAAS